MTMLVDLQRCRRMVASMRGLVMVSSLRLKLFKDAQLALTKRDERVRERQEKAARCGEAPLSPRAHYLRDFRGQRIRVIQRLWRKHRWQRVIVEKIKFERKWRAKRGNKRMELSATTIQRVFRGHCVRKKRKGKPQLSLLATVVLAQQQSRLERLHTTRLQYIKRLGSRRHALEQAHRDLALALHDKAATEEKIAKTETTNGTSGKTGSLFVDAKLLDGTVVRMEAHQLLVHQVNEITRLEETLVHLEREIQELEGSDPIVHQAARSIQEGFRRYRERKHDELDRKKQRLAELRRWISSERCYERMNAGFLQRQREMWHCKALILDGLYRIIVAKRLRQHYREKRAVAVIERIYSQRLDRVDAQRRLEWRRTKLRAELFALKRVRRSFNRVWQHWQAEVAFQRQRRARISQVLASGHTTWITTKAIRLQRVFRRAMALRRCLDDQVVPVLHPGLRHTIESAVASSPYPRDQFLQFFQRVTQTMHAWRVPTKHLYNLAQRYTLPLDALHLDEIWTWLLSQPQQHHDAHTWFLDLRSPFSIRTLRFLAPLSRFFDLHDRISYQEEQIWIHYEALRCVREYLVLLFAHDAVAYTPATTFSVHQREQAMTTLRRLLLDDDQQSSEEPQWTVPYVSAFTQFHCVWTDLCEHCLAMQPSVPPTRACAICGHRHIEKSTAAQASHAAVARPLDSGNNPSSLPQWIRASERCDFLVLNAFFHALAPRGHVHRELYAPNTLWKIALAKALEPVTALYDQFGIRTLNDLMIAETDTLAQALPSPVTSKLGLFIRLIKHELLELVANQTERGTRA